MYVWYSNGVCQIRRDAFRPYHGTTGPNEQIVRSCVKTDIQSESKGCMIACLGWIAKRGITWRI